MREVNRRAVRGRLRKFGAMVAAVLLMTGAGAAVAGAAPIAAPVLRAPAGGYQELTVPSGMGPVQVQVQWAARGGSAALYVLDGLRAPRDHSQWVSDTDVLQRFAGDDVTLVFPVGGNSSFYSDWYRPSSTNGQATTYKWETFLTEELPNFLARYGVSRKNNAVVGASMGGGSALTLAAHHRDQFKFAGSFSGFVNPTFPMWSEAVRVAMWDEGRFNMEDMWGPAGDPAWRRNDPTVQAELLRGLPMYISAGNGVPGPSDVPYWFGDTINAMGLEAMAMMAAQIFRDRVTALGIPARIDIVNGTHTWPYWEQAITTARPMILDALGAE